MDKVCTEYCEKIHKCCEALALGGRVVQIMEICGTHTMAIARGGLRSLLPKSLRLVSGPGCPVCVTDQSYMDRAVYLARGGRLDGPPAADAPVVATYGDMIRVPGQLGSLAEARSAGAAVEVVYAAGQAVELAKKHPRRDVVFLAVGFETTAPATALAVRQAREDGVGNFSVLTAHKRLLPAMRALLSAGEVPLDGFLCPGHVSVILGYAAYEEIVRDFGRPCVVAGFDAAAVLAGLAEIVAELLAGQPKACTTYSSVSREGNRAAQSLLEEVFVPCDEAWRALGVIPGSGMSLREEYADFDAARRRKLPEMPGHEMPGCRCGDVIAGRCAPQACGLFARRCTPRDPVGPCMVSSEGACAAAFKYERHDDGARGK